MRSDVRQRRRVAVESAGGGLVPPASKVDERSIPRRGGDWVDERLGLAGAARRQLNKAFPDHWSFMLGEIALYSFIILLMTGTYLAFFFEPSLGEVRYHGSYVPLHNLKVSEAYDSTLKISFDVRGGLIIRQIHHWAALLFVASILVHMLRIFFTGAFRKPREMNWVIGTFLLLSAVFEGFLGYSLPDDELSGTGLRIASSVLMSIPIVGTWLQFLIFGGEFPGTDVIQPRMYVAHVLLIPGIILALVSLHLTLVVVQKHTQFPGRRNTEQNVIGERVLPHYAAKSLGFFFLVFGTVALLAGLVQINPIWIYGPYEPSVGATAAQPDWYMGFLEGAIRLFPPWEVHFPNHTIPAPFWPTVVMPLLLTLLMLSYPFLEARLTGDRARHNLLQRPRDVPMRTALGAMAITYYLVLFAAGGDDVIADVFDWDINTTVWAGRVLLLLLPPGAFWVAYRCCLGLQRKDREILEHGIETGLVRRTPSGGYIEIHQPVAGREGKPLGYAGTPVPKKLNPLYAKGRKVWGFLTPIEEDKQDLAPAGKDGPSRD